MSTSLSKVATGGMDQMNSMPFPGHWKKVIQRHCDPDQGSPYWIDTVAQWNIDPTKDLRTLADLKHIPFCEPHILSERPVEDFIPRALLGQSDRWIVGETGGLTGSPAFTVYRNDEFHEAFIRPFLVAARRVNFPKVGRWLWIGPSGPHLIGKAARQCAFAQGQADPFAIDFDPRWARKLTPGSMSFKRYLDHVIEQSLRIINVQDISTLFTTPVVLNRLIVELSESQRSKIKGIHYGGMTSLGEDRMEWSRQFPNAVLLAGYGNTLFGVLPEFRTSGAEPSEALQYYPVGNRLWFEALQEVDDTYYESNEDKSENIGRLVFSRFDETQMILRALERDQGKLLMPTKPELNALDVVYPGIENPEPWQKRQEQIAHATGLY